MWRLTHTLECRADVDFAWRFWTNVKNWVLDPAVDQVWVEPAFAAGARGTTVTGDGARTEWQIVELVPVARAHIEIPAPGATLHSEWSFRPAEGGGSSLTQEMYLSGARAGEYERELAPAMDASVPVGMQRLADAIDAAYRAEPR